MTEAGGWIEFSQPSPDARLKLYCFPYAGGAAQVYRLWHRELPPGVQVCPIQLPGRWNRLREPPFTRMDPLVQAAANALQLAERLAALKKIRPQLDQEQYEREASDWAGQMSETWERMISLEVVGQVFDVGTQEVRPKMFRILSRVTEQDNTDFQTSYGRCSQWARRHDKSLAVNHVAPTVDEMESELAFVRTWYDRVRKYRS